MNDIYPFYFAVPRAADKTSRENVPAHLEQKYGAKGTIQHVRSEAAFRLYRVVP